MPTAITAGRSVSCPSARIMAPAGDVYIANGLDKVKRWDGFTSEVENAGIPAAPVGSFIGAGGGSGTLTGTYVAAVRFIDDAGIPGDLSASSAEFTLSSDATVDYTNVPVSSDPRVTSRQIFRNTPGQTDVFYLDITISNNVDTTGTGSSTDAQLQASTILQIQNPDRTPSARRYGVPPDHMRVIDSYRERTFLSVPMAYSEGHAFVTSSATASSVKLTGGTVTSAMAGRNFTVEGAQTNYSISSVNTSANSFTISPVWQGTRQPFARYQIYPADQNSSSERNKIYYSWPGEPEAMLSTDAVIMDGDLVGGDDQTGTFKFASFFYLTTLRDLFRWSFTTNPAVGAIWHNASRGLLNHRVQASAEGFVYLMDLQGIYRFNGSVDEIDQPIQDLFREQVVWENSKWWHATAFPDEESVKFFITLDGSYYPRHALVFNYRTHKWWIEEYPHEIGDSTLVPSPTRRKLIVGSERNSVFIQDSVTDGPKLEMTGRYVVSSATTEGVTVTGADWTDADLADAPIAVVVGRGKKQRRRILSATSSTGVITIDRPWSIVPNTTSTVQIGGIHYQLATKHFTNSEGNSERVLQVFMDPTQNAGTGDVRIYENRATTASTVGITDSNQENVKSTRGDANLEMNLIKARTDGNWDGVTRIGMGNVPPTRGSGNRFVQIEIDGDTNKEPITIREINVEGVQ